MSNLREHAVELARQGADQAAYIFLQKAVKDGDVYASNDLGVLMERHECYKEAYNFYCFAWEHKVPVAAYNLGNLYLRGLGVEQNYEEAVKYFTYAAEAKYAPAFDSLSVMAHKGQGMEKSDEKSFEYILSGIDYEDKKNPILSNNAAFYYESGIGTAVDENKSFELYKRAAKYDKECSTYNLGLCYLFGKGTKVNVNKAIDLLLTACENKYPDAFYQLFKIYYEGKCVEKNNMLAFSFLYRGLDLDSPRCHLAMANIYDGTDNPENEPNHLVSLKALRYYLDNFMDDELNVERYEDFKEEYPHIVDYKEFEKNPDDFIECYQNKPEA